MVSQDLDKIDEDQNNGSVKQSSNTDGHKARQNIQRHSIFDSNSQKYNKNGSEKTSQRNLWFTGFKNPKEASVACQYYFKVKAVYVTGKNKQRYNITWVSASFFYLGLFLLLVALVIGSLSKAPKFKYKHNEAFLIVNFVLQFLGLIPCALILSNITEKIQDQCGNAAIAALMNVSFGNLTELIVAVLALTKGLFTIVQTSLMGSMMSNLLLVNGCSFIVGGICNYSNNRLQQKGVQVINGTGTRVSLFTLIVVVMSLLYVAAVSRLTEPSKQVLLTETSGYGAAIFLIILYIAYLFFSVQTHAHLMEVDQSDPTQPQPPSREQFNTNYNNNNNNGVKNSLQNPQGRGYFLNTFKNTLKNSKNFNGLGSLNYKRLNYAMSSNRSQTDSYSKKSDHDTENQQANGSDEEDQDVNYIWLFIGLLVSSAFVGVLSEFLTDSLQEFSQESGISQNFIGMVLLPIAGNACEHISAVLVAKNNQMDLSVNIGVGSSIQIGAFVLPICTIIAWGLRLPVIINYDIYLVIELFIASFLIFAALAFAEIVWYTGVALLLFYIIWAVQQYFY